MPENRQSAIFLVEDEAAVRDALVFRLTVAGYAVKAYDAAAPFLAELDPAAEGCLVTDLNLPGLSGQELLEHLVAVGSSLAVIVITGFADVQAAVRAVQAGAVDFLEKPVDPAALIQAIRRALELRRSEHALRHEATIAATRIATLSEREREVFDGLVAGKLGKQIAIDLGISPRTVEIHRARVMDKLGTRTTSEIVRMGIVGQLLVGRLTRR
jgi:two-component system response regulator FixJ